MGRARSGNLLALVSALALLLFFEMSIVRIAASGNSRHLGKVNAHLRAIFVAESAFARLLTRVRARNWDRRWFANGPQLEADVQLCGGTYSSYIRTLPSENDHMAELWIEARYETAIVGTYWLVRSREDTLDFRSQVIPRFFTFLPTDSSRPTAAVNPISPLVAGMLLRQSQNAVWAREFLDQVRDKPDLDSIAALMQIPGELRPATDVMSANSSGPAYLDTLPPRSPRVPRRVSRAPAPDLPDAGAVETALPSIFEMIKAYIAKYMEQVVKKMPAEIMAFFSETSFGNQ